VVELSRDAATFKIFFNGKEIPSINTINTKEREIVASVRSPEEVDALKEIFDHACGFLRLIAINSDGDEICLYSKSVEFKSIDFLLDVFNLEYRAIMPYST